MNQPQVERTRPTPTLAEAVERDDKRLRLQSRQTAFTPEYRAWLKRQAAKRKGRNQ